MATIHENLTSQIDGITDTFTTVNDISGGVVVDYNGQVVNDLDITILTSTTFQLSFVPQLLPSPSDTLGAWINPDKFDITSQVDGIKTIFTADPSDLGQGDFLAILNGQILADETTTISFNKFKLLNAPQIGDTLEYFRVIDITQIGCSDIVNGIVNVVQLIGVINEPESQILGSVNEPDTVLGIIKT